MINYKHSPLLLVSVGLLFSCGNSDSTAENTHVIPAENPTEIASNAPDIEEVEIDEDQQKVMANIEEFVLAILGDDREFVTGQINYPLKRDAPLPAIIDSETMLANFETLFDQNLDAELNEYIENPDIIDLRSSNGTVGILNGLIWFNDMGTEIVTINYISAEEKSNIESLKTEVQNALYESISDYTRNVFIGKTQDYLFRIDDTDKGLRYSSWSSNQTMSDEPDFILYNGNQEQQGSAGGWRTTFDNGDLKYILDEVEMGNDPADCGIFLLIEDEGKVNSKSVVTEILDPLLVLPN